MVEGDRELTWLSSPSFAIFPDRFLELLMFEGDIKLTWLSSPSFAICPNRFLVFLRIDRSSRDVCGVGDSAVGTTSILAVGDSSVGTTSFSTNLWSKIGLVVNI